MPEASPSSAPAPGRDRPELWVCHLGTVEYEDGPDFTGVWVEDRKIASIGVHVARGVTTHGFAVNVENDLQPFGWVVPCGLEGVQMTSLIKETGRLQGQLKCFRRRAAFRVSEALGRRQRLVSLQRLEAALAPVLTA